MVFDDRTMNDECLHQLFVHTIIFSHFTMKRDIKFLISNFISQSPHPIKSFCRLNIRTTRMAYKMCFVIVYHDLDS